MEFLKVLVLGATGRLGGILRTCWGDTAPDLKVTWQGRPLVEPGFHPATYGGARGDVLGDARADWVRFDLLRDPQALAMAARGMDAILCLAGVTPAAAAAGADMAQNTALALAAIRAAGQVVHHEQVQDSEPDGVQNGGPDTGQRRPPYVFVTSSAAVYGRAPSPLQDTQPPETLTPAATYGAAKQRMEIAARTLGGQLGVPVCALRIGNVAGADAILGGWKPGFVLDRFADGRTPRRSYIGPQTLARGIADLLRAAKATGDLPPALNIACPGALEMGALLDAAGLEWRAQNAPNSAIAEVELSTRLIQTFTMFSKVECQAQDMVEQWRALGSPT